MSLETRSTDAKGRVSLPKEFANATVIIEQVNENEIRIRKARVIPEDSCGSSRKHRSSCPIGIASSSWRRSITRRSRTPLCGVDGGELPRSVDEPSADISFFRHALSGSLNLAENRSSWQAQTNWLESSFNPGDCPPVRHRARHGSRNSRDGHPPEGQPRPAHESGPPLRLWSGLRPSSGRWQGSAIQARHKRPSASTRHRASQSCWVSVPPGKVAGA